jgi:hypothetical protein
MVSQPRSVQLSRWDEAIFLMIPGTSCLATIVLSLRDKIHSTAGALLMGFNPGNRISPAKSPEGFWVYWLRP